MLNYQNIAWYICWVYVASIEGVWSWNCAFGFNLLMEVNPTMYSTPNPLNPSEMDKVSSKQGRIFHFLSIV